MPPLDSNKRLVIITGIVAVLCGAAIAGLLLWTTGRTGTPRTYKPFNAGYEYALRKTLTEGGPFYYADPFGGNAGFWFALDNGQITAVAVSQPNDPTCAVRWRGSKQTFVDCHDAPVALSTLARYPVTYQGSGKETLVYVDLRTREPAPKTP